VFGEKVVEKMTVKVSFRIPQSWKRDINEKKLDLTAICREAVFIALQKSEKVLTEGMKSHSKLRAAQLYNSLKPFFVRTESDKIRQEIRSKSFKTLVFREYFLPRAHSDELIVLAEFLQQGQDAEEVLQEIYHE
jgi:hypothetical protein